VVNDPVPPREINPDITPELQEIVYRALARVITAPANLRMICPIRTACKQPAGCPTAIGTTADEVSDGALRGAVNVSGGNLRSSLFWRNATG
jgi:hypothetical protein